MFYFEIVKNYLIVIVNKYWLWNLNAIFIVGEQ